MSTNQKLQDKWALVLGSSSGFGAAASLALARAGLNIFGVHLDLKATLPKAKQVVADIEAMGRQAVFFNTNAADERKRRRVLGKIEERLAASGQSTIWVMLHSLAFGTLLPFIADEPDGQVSPTQMDMTLNVMAHSLVYWAQDLSSRKLLGTGSRIFSMTSTGSHRVVRGYGAVSAAKAALEAHTRQLALELAPQGVLVNCIQAGVTDTPSMRKIPNSAEIIAHAKELNPFRRITTPEDVAKTIVAISTPDVVWISGSVIHVDGGEDVVG